MVGGQGERALVGQRGAGARAACRVGAGGDEGATGADPIGDDGVRGRVVRHREHRALRTRLEAAVAVTVLPGVVGWPRAREGTISTKSAAVATRAISGGRFIRQPHLPSGS